MTLTCVILSMRYIICGLGWVSDAAGSRNGVNIKRPYLLYRDNTAADVFLIHFTAISFPLHFSIQYTWLQVLLQSVQQIKQYILNMSQYSDVYTSPHTVQYRKANIGLWCVGLRCA